MLKTQFVWLDHPESALGTIYAIFHSGLGADRSTKPWSWANECWNLGLSKERVPLWYFLQPHSEANSQTSFQKFSTVVALPPFLARYLFSLPVTAWNDSCKAHHNHRMAGVGSDLWGLSGPTSPPEQVRSLLVPAFPWLLILLRIKRETKVLLSSYTSQNVLQRL